MILTYNSNSGKSFTYQVVLFSSGIAQPPIIITMTPPQNSYGASVDIEFVTGIQVLDSTGQLLAQCNPFPPQSPAQMMDASGRLVPFFLSWNQTMSAVVIMDDSTDKSIPMGKVHHITLAEETAALLKELFSVVGGKHVTGSQNLKSTSMELK